MGRPDEFCCHSIRSINGPLKLKIELPNTFDDGRHYDEADRQFLTDAATTAGEVLGEFRQFLNRDWFSGPDSVHAVVNVTRMAAELLRTRVLSPVEAQALWEGLRDFVNRNEDDVQEEMRETIRRLSLRKGRS
jgi:hypothetical protein